MRAFLGLAAFLVITTVLAVGWTTQPDRFSRGYAPEQPIDFSHKKHAGMMQIPCMYCHTGVTKSRSAGIPPTEICMNCHRFAKTDSPEIKKVAASQGILSMRQDGLVKMLNGITSYDEVQSVVDLNEE